MPNRALAALSSSAPPVHSASEATAPDVSVGDVRPIEVLALERLDLAAVILCLFAALLAFDEPLTLDYVALAVLAVMVCGRVITPPDLRRALTYGSIPPVAFGRLLLEWGLVVGLLLLAGFALKVSDQYARSVLLTWFGATPVALLVVHELQGRTARWLNRRGAFASRYVVVGVTRAGAEVLRRLGAVGFLGWFDFRSPERIGVESTAVRPCTALGDFVRANRVDAVYITLPVANTPRIHALLGDLQDSTASVYFVPDVFGFALLQARVVDVNGIPALAVCDTPLRGTNAFAKRATDVVVSLLALLALAPLVLAIAFAVKVSSPGPVFFRQRRYGLDGEEIVVLKFRTMTVCEDGTDVRQATAGDRRVTALGAVLRRTSLDELPQLLNVLRGEMSLVGPRPHAVAHNELYRRQVSGYMLRHKVRPGITGWAQVHGLRGETDTVDKMALRVRYDLEYLSRWSLVLDVRILLRTVLVVLRGVNAY